MNEDYENNYSDGYIHSPSDSVRYEIDYEEIENAFYRALNRVNEDNTSQEGVISEVVYSDLVQFHTSTDAELMTCKVEVPLTSCAEQSTAYLLDIRNILFLFLSIYFIFTSYSKIKSSILHLYKARS